MKKELDDNQKKLGDALRERRVGDSEDIGVIWEEQGRKEKQRLALQKQYAANKAKSKLLKKEILKEYTDPSELNGKLVDFFRKLKKFKYKKSFTGLAVLIVVIVLMSSPDSNQSTDTLGDSTKEDNFSSIELPIEQPQFKLLYPVGQNLDSLDVVRVSPDGSAPAYTYLDKFKDSLVVFRVTQQEIPKDFDVEKAATEFQATNVIQVDDTKIYHGYSEKGKTQSIIFEKNGRLLSIRSPEKYPDDIWASYYLGLQ